MIYFTAGAIQIPDFGVAEFFGNFPNTFIAGSNYVDSLIYGRLTRASDCQNCSQNKQYIAYFHVSFLTIELETC